MLPVLLVLHVLLVLPVLQVSAERGGPIIFQAGLIKGEGGKTNREPENRKLDKRVYFV